MSPPLIPIAKGILWARKGDVAIACFSQRPRAVPHFMEGGGSSIIALISYYGLVIHYTNKGYLYYITRIMILSAGSSTCPRHLRYLYLCTL